MMTTAALVVLLLDLAFIAALPKIFFRADGRLNVMWFVTAGPFAVCAVVLLLHAAGVLGPAMTMTPALAAVHESVGVALAIGSIALIAYTLGTHRAPLALWHQTDDAPSGIVTHGAYARIRHPFYAAFLLGLAGAAIALPHPGTAIAFVYGVAILNATAAREERRLLASSFGAEYRAYVDRTGRFLPRLDRDPMERSAA
jgi:protein-S-isoprenylcysteine O-methyltransferase Ste14